MRRSTLILIVALVVVLGAAAALYLTGMLKLPTNNTNTSTQNENLPLVNSTTNTAVTNSSLPANVQGDTILTGSLTIGGVKMTISSLQYTARYADVSASSGKQLVMVYTDPIPNASITAVVDGMTTDMKVTYTGGEAMVRRYKVASDTVKNDHGYFLFEVPKNAGALTLVYGADLSAQKLTIPAAK